MLKITSDRTALETYLHSFNWTFKISDNILYNLDISFQLIDHHNNSNGCNYAKPISISCVSIIEAIFVDFLERLDSATHDFPVKLDSKRILIKNALNEEKKEIQTTYEGKVYKYKRLRNFGYEELIEFYEKFKILGSASDTYKSLQNLGRFRNRIHIRNYFENFERDESRTFSEDRTQQTIDYMVSTFKYFAKNYPRP